MKRKGYLMPDIVAYHNLTLSFWKARKGKAFKKEVMGYREMLEEHICRLQKQMLNGTVEIGSYTYFTITDPKERLICAASFNERVVHHAIMNICHPYFENFQIDQSYATRKGKGQYAALKQAAIYNKKHTWFCKLDVRKYFDSINHEVLKSMLGRMFKDKSLLKLLYTIIDSYQTCQGKGLPIGNLTSQYFANHYLTDVDRFVKQQLKVKAYVRYMDDMVLWSNSKDELLKNVSRLQTFIEQQLDLQLKPECLHQTKRGLPFLGYVLFPGCIRLSKQSKQRFNKKAKHYYYKLKTLEWSQEQFTSHIVPLFAFVQHANSYKIRHKIVNEEAGLWL